MDFFVCVFPVACFRVPENTKLEHRNWQKCKIILNACTEVAGLPSPWQVSCNYYKS